MSRFSRFMTFILLMALLAPSLAAANDMFHRRKSQYPTQDALLVIPFPYNLPGIGGGLGFVAASANMFDTTTDLYAVILTGDVTGQIIGLDDIPIIPEVLTGNLGYQDIGKATITFYSTRGMDSDPNAYNFVEVSDIKGMWSQLCLCLFDKRLGLMGFFQKQSYVLEAIRDKDGVLIQGSSRQSGEGKYQGFGVSVDITDDFQDPRRGFQVDIFRTLSLGPESTGQVDQYALDKGLQVYLPVGKSSTLALRYNQADAVVTRQGETDKDILAQDLTGGAIPSYNLLPPELQASVDNAYTANKFGTAGSLGGENKLRGYPGGRFSGASVALLTAEFRWNLTEEATPFDWFIWRDVRTNMQVAFFYEVGTVADPPVALWDQTKTTYGVGYRMVSASGYVYRADLAITEEGTVPILFFNYPF